MVRGNLQKRLDVIDDFLFRMDGRLEKQGAPVSVRLEFLHDALTLSEGLLKEQPKDPTARRQTGRLYYSSGELWRQSQRFDEADDAFRKALALQKQLADDFAAQREYRNDLALTYAQQARLLRDFRRFPESQTAYDRAVRLQDALAKEDPNDPAYRQNGANYRFLRADLLEEAGQARLAETDYLRGPAAARRVGGGLAAPANLSPRAGGHGRRFGCPAE